MARDVSRRRWTGQEDVSGRQVRRDGSGGTGQEDRSGDGSGGTGQEGRARRTGHEDGSVRQVRETGQEGRVMRTGQWDDRGGV